MSSGYLWVFMHIYNCESERWVDAIEGIVKKYPDRGIELVCGGKNAREGDKNLVLLWIFCKLLIRWSVIFILSPEEMCL